MSVDELRKSLVGVPGHLRVVTQGDPIGQDYPSATSAEVVEAERYQQGFVSATFLAGGRKATVFLIRR
jgi:hypothetical protein